MNTRMHQIGRYLIEEEIGRGAMGVVYRALDPAIGRHVAIKTIRLNELAEPGERQKLRDRLFREAQSAGMLSHPGIVTIYDTAEAGELAWIAMELVDGLRLDLLAAEQLDGATVLSILEQTAAALDYAHRRGIVHRDIKPANIMIHEGTTAKITDFGVARIQSHQLTQSGTMVGTPSYMSPEQIQGQPVDGRSDQFSLAVIAYELLTGEKPFTADSIAALAYRIVRHEPAPVQRLNPTLDWPVDTVLRRALAKDPADRYPTCSDFVVALGNACKSCAKWTPLPPGAAHNMATVAAAVPAPAHEPIEEPVRSSPEFTDEDEQPQAPGALRLMRKMAYVAVALMLAGAAFVGALNYIAADVEEPAASTAVQEEPPVQRAQRPSAMPALPGDPGENPPPAEDRSANQQQEAPVPAPEPPPAPRPAQQGSSVSTRIVTNPPGAFVVVDGASASSCTSPCSLELEPGRHTLAATMSGFRRTLRIFETPADAELFLNLDRSTGTVAVRSEPRGASIIVDGERRPEVTPAMLNLPIGRHTIELVRNGRRQSHQVTVQDSVITELSVTLP